MEVRYSSESIQQLETVPRLNGRGRLPAETQQSLRDLVRFMKAAHEERDLQMAWLGLVALDGNQTGKCSMTLAAGYRLIFTLEEKAVVIHRIEQVSSQRQES